MEESFGSNEVVELSDGRFLVKNNQKMVENVYQRIFDVIERMPEPICMLDVLTAVALVGVHIAHHQKVSKGNFMNLISQEWERLDHEVQNV